METPPSVPKKSPDIAVLVASAIAVVALLAWLVSWWAFSSDEDAISITREEKSKSNVPVAHEPPRVEAPAAPAPSPQTEVPPLAGDSRRGNAEAPQKPPSPSLAPDTRRNAAEAPVDKARPSARPADSAATPQPTARAEGGASKGPPAQAATRAAPERGAQGADPVLDALRGRYSGNYFDSSGSSTEMIGLTLVISSVENGVVKGTAQMGGRGCHGEYPMQGAYQNKTLNLRATRKGGPAGDCPLNLVLAVEGDKLAGAADNGDKVQLRK